MGHVVGEDRIRARDGRMKLTMALKCGVSRFDDGWMGSWDLSVSFSLGFYGG